MPAKIKILIATLRPALIFWAAAFSIRIFQLLQLYLMRTPSGGVFVERAAEGFICAFIADFAAFAFFAAFFALATLLKGTARRASFITISTITWIYLAICATNDQLLRWMGQHLTLSFLSTYSVSTLDPTMTRNIVQDGIGSFTLTVAFLVAAGVAFFFICKKDKDCGNLKLLSIGLATILAASAIVCGNTHKFLKPCRIRWHLTQPPYITLLNEWDYQQKHSQQPKDFESGIRTLGGNEKNKHPFFHPVENEDSLTQEFTARPLSEKYDVILLSLESLRGWASDFRIGKNCERMPNLCRLSKKGTTFPYTYSTGYPSTEGMLGLQLGIWSHPNKIFLSSLMNVKTRSLPEILGSYGYHRIVLSAAEPSFDNFSPWFEKWFDIHEYNPKITTDIPLAHRFKELYESRPADKPLYMEWINFVTHTPFKVPETFAKPAESSDERYGQAQAYLDSAIGIILEVIENSPRSKETIVVVTGDHSIPNAKSQEKLGEQGEANSGYTWTSFIWNGPGIQDSLLVTSPVSHVDYAPTVMNLLGIKASNHFVGHNLFEGSRYPVYSFRHHDAIVRSDSTAIFAREDDKQFSHARKQSREVDWDTTETIGGFVMEPKIEMDVSTEAAKLTAAMESWIWILDKNLLLP